MTEGTFMVGGRGTASSRITFGPNQTDHLKSAAVFYGLVGLGETPTLLAGVPAVFLVSPRSSLPSSLVSSLTTMVSSMSQASESSSKGVNNMSEDEDDAGSPISFQVGVGVGVSIGPILLICLGFLFLKRYRRKRLGPLQNGGIPAEEKRINEYSGKPELEGSPGHRGPFLKPELDALAIRAEIEGSPGDEREMVGVGIPKPELHGTPGQLGVYVRRKTELEASFESIAIPRAGSSAHNSVQDEPDTNSTSELAGLGARRFSFCFDPRDEILNDTPLRSRSFIG
ncbi:hypothetical protein O1611_g725 [Lasiodiplodia mahajangana]|uniref:Uncharacterized protein n=1 Tax=Lasiodiplodia mahajangana TaxID=1108764 RepID=A0ACC2JZP7_9PEZI|nr:hypothetical protein O1611_g725 [Lasiodiplodia mahajangana]